MDYRSAITERRRKLGVADRHAGTVRELGGVLDGACSTRRRVREQPVDKACLHGLGGLQRGGVGDEVDALCQADAARQSLGAAGPGEQAEVHLRQTDLVAALGREAQVARQRQLETAAQAVAGDGRDEHERRVLHLAEGLVGQQRQHEARPRRARREYSNVGPGAEELLGGAGDHHVAHVAVQPRVIDRAGKFPQKCVVVAVGRGLVQDDDANVAFLLESY